MVVLLTLVVLIAGGGALALWLSRRLTDHGAQTAHVLDQLLAARNTEVDGRLQAITATMDRRLGELDTKVDRRLEHAAKQTNAIHRQLGEVGQATVQMAEQAKELSQLQQILRPPKARGGFGELLLENLLRDRLPPTAFELQYGFAGGERVDGRAGGELRRSGRRSVDDECRHGALVRRERGRACPKARPRPAVSNHPA